MDLDVGLARPVANDRDALGVPKEPRERRAGRAGTQTLERARDRSGGVTKLRGGVRSFVRSSGGVVRFFLVRKRILVVVVGLKVVWVLRERERGSVPEPHRERAAPRDDREALPLGVQSPVLAVRLGVLQPTLLELRLAPAPVDRRARNLGGGVRNTRRRLSFAKFFFFGRLGEVDRRVVHDAPRAERRADDGGVGRRRRVHAEVSDAEPGDAAARVSPNANVQRGHGTLVRTFGGNTISRRNVNIPLRRPVITRSILGRGQVD